MALFEKTNYNKVAIDDTEKLTCYVENTQNINKHTEYVLRVQRGPLKDNSWHVSHRYSDFAELNTRFQQAGIELPLPPKKFFGNMQPSFIAERHKALQIYIEEVLKSHKLALSYPVRSFLDPDHYSKTILEEALQTISIALRGDGRFELKTPLTDIGWRIRKQYFLVTESGRQTNCMLCWQSYGPDKYLDSKNMQSTFKSLLNISHPNIDKILAIYNLENGAYVVRNIHESGSVRDVLYGTEYNNSYLTKYGNPKIRKPFTMGQIAHFGLQILQALKFLNEKDIPHGHIHPGNIMIENQKALLVDIENSVIGGPCIYREYVLEHRKICTTEAVDVYCFAHTLYEMVFAEPLEQATCDIFPSNICEELDDILKSCLSMLACKQGMPTIDTLLEHPFFHNTYSLTNGQAMQNGLHLKFPLPLKEHLKNSIISMEARLKKDQKLVRKAKREVRIQEILSSEEEVKKHKRRLKKRESWWKSTSSLTETVRSNSFSTSSSPTPPTLPETSRDSTSMSITPGSPSDGRGALLSAICSFDKSRLARINSQ